MENGCPLCRTAEVNSLSSDTVLFLIDNRTDVGVLFWSFVWNSMRRGPTCSVGRSRKIITCVDVV